MSTNEFPCEPWELEALNGPWDKRFQINQAKVTPKDGKGGQNPTKGRLT